MASRLERTEEVRRQLIGDVAHELRTPLSVIRGSLEALIDGVMPADESTLLKLHEETGRLQRLVGDLQELSRVEAGAVELKPGPAAVDRLVEVVVERLQRQFEDKGVHLRVEAQADLPRVLVDEERTGQVLLNVVGNALQYTPPGRDVTIRARRAGAQVEIEVADQGIGIAPEHLPQIFTRFYRAERSRSRAGGGSGIGLTIARHLAEAQGGSLRAESPGPGKGSRFTVCLPVAAGTFTEPSSSGQPPVKPPG
jgi:histidine kinase